MSVFHISQWPLCFALGSSRAVSHSVTEDQLAPNLWLRRKRFCIIFPVFLSLLISPAFYWSQYHRLSTSNMVKFNCYSSENTWTQENEVIRFRHLRTITYARITVQQKHTQKWGNCWVWFFYCLIFLDWDNFLVVFTVLSLCGVFRLILPPEKQLHPAKMKKKKNRLCLRAPFWPLARNEVVCGIISVLLGMLHVTLLNDKTYYWHLLLILCGKSVCVT